MPDNHTALLVMDVQEGIVERLGDASLLERVERAIAAARAAGTPVIYVKVDFRPAFPEVSPRNRSFAQLAQADGGFLGEKARVHPAVAPQPGDVEVTKRRVSGFTGSDLQVVLRAQEVTTLVLTGIATSGVVLSTLREAADLDYELTVLSDCCADGDPEVHRVLLEKVFPRQAEVTDVETWARRLSG
jgi:nicotinamidase-related amidase